MAVEFAQWLQDVIAQEGADELVLVVGLIGKSDSRSSKTEVLDQLLDRSVCCGKYPSDSAVHISAYYSEFHQIVFLTLNSIHDADVQEQLFDAEKPFFDVLKDAEAAHIEHLFVLFVCCHLIAVVHPDLRIDLSLLRDLTAVNEMRVQRRRQLIRKLENISALPSGWQGEGRLALPRLLFLFKDNRSPRNGPGSETNAVETSNYLEKLERNLEYQLVHMLRRTQICSEHLGISLASMAPRLVPFVRIARPSEMNAMLLTETLSRLFSGDVLFSELRHHLQEPPPAIDTVNGDSQLTMSKFLLGHVKDVITNEKKLPKYYFAVPKRRTFAQGAQCSLKLALNDDVYSQKRIKNWLSEELHLINDQQNQIGYCGYELYLHLVSDKIGSVFYNPNMTEVRHYRALQHVVAYLKVFLLPKQLAQEWDDIQSQCNARFNRSQQRCTEKSISGAQCYLLTHRVPAKYTEDEPMEKALRGGRSYQHCSAYSYLSTCNCGQTQKKRNDPFSAKEANYDFYSTFACCSKVESMPFRLYNPNIKWDLSRTTSVVVNKRDRSRYDAASSGPNQRRVQLLKRTNKAADTAKESDRFSSYTIVKPKSTTRLTHELLWQYNRMMHQHEGRYLAHLWHTSLPDATLTPLYPSWFVGCLGPSSAYVHIKGLAEQPSYVPGSEFLQPWDTSIIVKTDVWSVGLRKIFGGERPPPWKERTLEENVEQNTHKEKLKFFVGFEYECPLGHRFMTAEPNKILIHKRGEGPLKTDAAACLNSDLPLYMPCKCSNNRAPVNAQLSRLQIVTPKAPVGVRLDPHIQFDDSGSFHMGQAAELNWGRHYVCRLPTVYEGPNGLISRPIVGAETNGVLLANCLHVYQKL